MIPPLCDAILSVEIQLRFVENPCPVMLAFQSQLPLDLLLWFSTQIIASFLAWQTVGFFL
jgi:hypothetical protein